jgi:hypothetical protein
VSRAFLDLFDIDCFKRPFHGEAKIALVYPNQCLERFDYSIFEYIVYENDYYFIMGYTSKDIFHIASIFRKQNTKSLILGFKYLKQLFIRILSEYSCLTGKVYLEPRDFTGSENDWRYAPSGGGSSTRLQNFYAAFGAEQTSRQNEYTLTLEKLENSMLGRSRLLQSL